MPMLHVLRPFARAALAALLVVGAWWVSFPRTSMPPVSPLGDQLVYSTADSAALVLLEPVLHAPWLGEMSWWAGLLAALVVAVGATGVAIFAGASVLATFFVVATLAVDASFGAALSHASGMAISVGLVWLAAGAAFDEHQRVSPARPWFNPLGATLLWGGAVWWDWIAVVTWPIVFAALRRAPERPARGAWTGASLVVGLAALAAHFQWMTDVAQSRAFAPSATLTLRDAVWVAFDARPRMPAGSFVAADLTSGVSYLAIGLAAVALIFADLERWWRRAVTLSALFVAAVVVASPVWQGEVLRFALWSLTPLGAVGLTWVAHQVARQRLAGAATMAIGSVLVAETVVMGARPLTGQDARGFRDALERALGAEVRRRAVLVAEDTRIDSALTAWAARRGDTTRAAQDGDVVAAAFGEGRTVLAGPTGRRHLELAGIAFRRRVTISEPAPFVMSAAVSALRCAIVRNDRWSQLPGLEYTGRLGIELPAGLGGEMQVIVGDTLPLQVWVDSADGREAPTVVESLWSGPGVAAPPPDYWFDGGLPEDGPQVIKRVRLRTHPARTSLLALHLGRRGPRVIARLAGVDDAARGRVCAAPIGRDPLLTDAATERIPLDDAQVFGTGWYGLERRGGTGFRWADTDAVVLLPSTQRMDVEVSLDADTDPGAADGTDPRHGAADKTDARRGAADNTETRHGAADNTDTRRRAADNTDTRRGAADGTDARHGAADGTDPRHGAADGTDARRGAADNTDTRHGAADAADGTTVTLRVNGIDVGTRRLQAGVRRYTWAVPAQVWLAGTNELWWQTSRAVRPSDTGGTDTRNLALRVTAIEVRRR